MLSSSLCGLETKAGSEKRRKGEESRNPPHKRGLNIERNVDRKGKRETKTYRQTDIKRDETHHTRAGETYIDRNIDIKGKRETNTGRH